MLRDAELVAFVPTRDLARSRRFYADVLGLELVESSSFANVFRSNARLLRVTLVEKLADAPHTVLGWVVGDIRSEIAALEASGVRFTRYDRLEQDDSGVWTAPSGSLVAWFEDPDGNVVSLEQPSIGLSE